MEKDRNKNNKVQIKYIEEQTAEMIYQEPGIDGLWKFIEHIARMSHNMQDHQSKNSKDFVMNMFDRGEGSPLEHGTVYLKCPNGYNTAYHNEYLDFLSFYENNDYSYCMTDLKNTLHVSTDLRFLAENGRLDDLYLIDRNIDMKKKNFGKYYIPRVSIVSDTNLQVAQELTRHRAFSYMAESTRVCNYGKTGQFMFMIPIWLRKYVNHMANDQDPFGHYRRFCRSVVNEYMYFLGKPYGEDGRNLVPQDVASGLTRDFAQTICTTGFVMKKSWGNFFNQRYFEKTGKVLPMMKELAGKMYDILDKNDYLGFPDNICD